MAQPFSILHVENDPDDRLFFERAIRRVASAATITHMPDGEAAKAYILSSVGAQGEPHLIVLDRKMPRCSGAEFLSWLRTRPNLPNYEVVMLSSSDLEDDVVASFAFGANAYFVKPMEWTNWVELAEKIRDRWLQAPQQV